MFYKVIIGVFPKNGLPDIAAISASQAIDEAPNSSLLNIKSIRSGRLIELTVDMPGHQQALLTLSLLCSHCQLFDENTETLELVSLSTCLGQTPPKELEI